MADETGTLLASFTEIALSLPEAERERVGDHTSFSVRGKKFAYYLDSHHGDGIVGICVKVGPGENTAMIASDPGRFYMPAYIGPRGWVALRLDVGVVDWEEVRELTTDSYLITAPKSISKGVMA